MKLIIFFMLIGTYLFGQNTIFEYQYIYKNDTLSDKYFIENYYLQKKDNATYFIGESELNIILSNGELNQVYSTTTNSKIKGFGKKLKPSQLKSVKFNYVNNNATFFRNYFDKIKITYHDSIKLKWNLINDTITCKGYKCHSAETNYSGRKYIAYYTLDIPSSDGPYIFNGLPGLIVCLRDTKKNHIFQLNNVLEKKINVNLEGFSNISKDEFYKIEDNYKYDPVRTLLPNSNMSSEKKQEIKAKMRENMKGFNNPIEIDN